jgi:hypothetical protein
MENKTSTDLEVDEQELVTREMVSHLPDVMGELSKVDGLLRVVLSFFRIVSTLV